MNANSVAEAFELRQYLHDQWQDHLLAPFAQSFDRVAPDADILYLPKLELRLTLPAGKDPAQILPDQIQQQLQDYFQRLSTKTVPDQNIVEQRVESSGGDRPDGQIISSLRSAIDLLLHYLHTGSMPWQVAPMPAAEVAQTLQQTCQRQPLLAYLRHNREPASFYFRLLQLLPANQWIALVQGLSTDLPNAWQRTLGQIVAAAIAPKQTLLNSYQQGQFVAAFLAESWPIWGEQRSLNSRPIFISIAHHTPAPTAFYAHLLESLPANEWLPLLQVLCTAFPTAKGRQLESMLTTVVDVKQSLTAEQQQSFTAEQQRQLIAALLLESWATPAPLHHVEAVLEAVLGTSAREIIQRVMAELSASDRLPSVDDDLRNSDQSIASAQSIASDSAQSFQEHNRLDSEIHSISDWAIAPTDNFPVSVRNAGLVLIHAFIPPYFAALGVDMTEPTAVVRAAALLHLLATGEETLYEYELDLIKVLLGLTPDAPLMVSAGLLQAGDRTEADTLLQSVIHYWTALKNTSVTGLRISFLQRPGLLRQTEAGWHLHVEPQSFDILLNSLPWTIGIVKFPWMPKPLYTEWMAP